MLILSIETVLLVRKDLTKEDIADILDYVEENEDKTDDEVLPI